MGIMNEAIGTAIILLGGFVIIPYILDKISNIIKKNSKIEKDYILTEKPVIIPNYNELRARERSFEDLQLKK